MQITSNTSLDSFLSSRPVSQPSRGNGDNESFARLMQERRDQAVPAPQPVPRSPQADTSDATYDMTPRQPAASDDTPPSHTGTRYGAGTDGPGGDAPATTRSIADAKTAAARKTQLARPDKPTTTATDGITNTKADADATSGTVKSTDATGATPADWTAQWAGITPKQAPVTDPADDAPAATPVVAATRTPVGATPDPVQQMIGSRTPTVGIVAPDDPRNPVGTPASADSNPISLTPTDNAPALKTDRAAPGLSPSDDPGALALLQGGALATAEVQKTEKPSTTEAVDNQDAAVGAAAAVAGSTHAPSQSSDVPSVQIATPVHAPEFKEALGVQVSMMARDGVQHAELHLNPADMGPISVQIATEGTQARVDFGADSAATRHIIEAGLPELASALHNAGLTLTGGGVSQHASGNSQGGSDSRDGSRGSRQVTLGIDGASTLGAATTSRAAQGALDLYA